MTLYNRTLDNFNKGFIGFATLAILGQSCLGGAAAMSILSNGISFYQLVQLAIVVMACVGVNTAILAQLSHKIILNLILVSVFFSCLFLIINYI